MINASCTVGDFASRPFLGKMWIVDCSCIQIFALVEQALGGWFILLSLCM